MSNLSEKSERESAAKQQLQSLLNEHEVAEVLKISVASLRRWRLLKQGPPYLKLGSCVRYRAEDLAAWLASRPTGGSDLLDKRERAS